MCDALVLTRFKKVPKTTDGLPSSTPRQIRRTCHRLQKIESHTVRPKHPDLRSHSGNALFCFYQQKYRLHPVCLIPNPGREAGITAHSHDRVEEPRPTFTIKQHEPLVGEIRNAHLLRRYPSQCRQDREDRFTLEDSR